MVNKFILLIALTVYTLGYFHAKEEKILEFSKEELIVKKYLHEEHWENLIAHGGYFLYYPAYVIEKFIVSNFGEDGVIESAKKSVKKINKKNEAIKTLLE